METAINGIAFKCNEELPEEEVGNYIARGLDKYGDSLQSIEAKTDGEDIELTYHYDETVPFERIRRITGYLVGTLDRFNDAKRAEESDRVKHSL